MEPICSCYGSIRAPVTMGSGGDGNNAKRAGDGVVIIRYAIGVTPQVPSGLMIYIR